MSRYIKTARTGLIVILTVCFAVLIAPFVMRAQAFTGPTATELATALHRVDLGPEALTAAGASANAAAGVVADAFVHVAEYQAELAAADAAYASSKRSRDTLERIVRAGRASSEQIADLAQSRSDYSGARAQQQSLTADLIDAATADLTGAQRSALDRIRLNRGWKLPVEYLTVDRTEVEWVALRDALANERIAAKLGEDPDATAQTLLLEVRSHLTVSTARANLDANLAAVTSAWEDALER